MKLIQLIKARETGPQAHAPFSLEKSLDRSALSKAYSAPLSFEIIQLQEESDPELRSQGLLSVATWEELHGDIAFATEAYAWLAAHGTGQTKEKAQERLGLMEGKGSFGQRAENLLRGFAREASDPVMLLAMGVGGSVYKATKLATMSRLVGSSGYLGRGVGMKLAGSVAGYALEAPVFTAVGRWGRGEKLLGPGLKEELLSSYLVLGAMKSVGGISRQSSRGLGHPRVEKFAGDVGLYGGILLGHKLETVTGLREWHDGGQEWVDGLAMLVQLKASGRILNQVGGERYRGMERELEYRSEHLANWGAIHRAANDGHYSNPIPRIGRVSDPRETAANEGSYGRSEAGLMPLAVGGEVFEAGEVATKPKPASSLEGMETGLQVYNMGKGGEASSEGVLRRLGKSVVGISKRSSPSEPVPASLAPTLDFMEVKSEHAEVAVPPLVSLIPPTRLERPKTVSIPGGIRALGSPDFSRDPVRWREIGEFELATRPVTNHEVETYAEEYRDYPLGLIWGDGNRYHLIGRGGTWDAGREAKAKASLESLFGNLAKNHSKEPDPIRKLLGKHGEVMNLLSRIASWHPRAPVFEWNTMQNKYSDWLEPICYFDYAVFANFLQSVGIEPSFEGVSLFFEGLKERKYFDNGWTFERQRVVPEIGGRKLDAVLNGSEQAATEINWYEAVGIANAMGGRLPTEWEQEVAARGPALRMDSKSNLENFENFYVGGVTPKTALIHDLGMVRNLITGGMEVFGYRRYGTESGSLNQQEAWYDQNTLPDRADWGPVNGYGLHGMVGGVWEWAGNNYDTKNPWRSLRGGSWFFNDPDFLRAAGRHGSHPDGRRFNFIGARVVMAPRTPR